VDDAKVTDHHALIPTGASKEGKQLNRDEERIYDLVCRRLLMAWHLDHKARVTKVVTAVEGDRFLSSGTVVTQVGWKALDVELRGTGRGQGKGAEPSSPRAWRGRSKVASVEIKDKQTSADQSLHRRDDADADGSAARRSTTASWRSDARARLWARGDARGDPRDPTRAGDVSARAILVATARARRSSTRARVGEGTQLTGEWEYALKKIERGQGSLSKLMEDIERFVVRCVGGCGRPQGGSQAEQVLAGKLKPEGLGRSSGSSASAEDRPRGVGRRAGWRAS
jgi:DNA topoisomerase-3